MEDMNLCLQSQQGKEEEIKQQRKKMENVNKIPVCQGQGQTHHHYDEVLASQSSPEEELTWDDAADICAPWSWSGDGVVDTAKSKLVEETVPSCHSSVESNSTSSSECHQQASRSLPSESNTYTVAPGSSTPTSCRSPISLPSFKQSPILPEMGDNDNRKDVGVGINVPFDLLKTAGRSNSGPYASASAEDSKMSSWQTSGVTRSEIEYQNRKKYSSSSLAEDDPSYIEIRVVSRPKNVQIRRDEPPQVVPTNDAEKHLGNVRSSRLREQLEEVRRLDNKISGAMELLHDSVEYERSKQRTSPSSSSGGSTMCKVVREYEKYLEMYPSEDGILAGPLEDHIHTHLLKIRHQIKLVEKYNRALLEKEAERSRNPKGKYGITQGKPSKNYSGIPRFRGYARCIPTGGEQRSKYKTRDASLESSKSGGSSYEQLKTATSNNFSRYSNGIGAAPKNIKVRVGASDRGPGQMAGVANAFQLRNPTVHSRMPATVAYERWTWPNGHQMQGKSVHEGAVRARKTGEITTDQEASTSRCSDRQNKNKGKGDTQRGNGGRRIDRSERNAEGLGNGRIREDSRRIVHLIDDQEQEELMEPTGCMNETFTKTGPCGESRNQERVFNQERIADEEELRSRSPDRRAAAKSRTVWTITDNNPKIQDQAIETAEPVTQVPKQGVDTVTVPRKSVAFYVPLFCDNCEDKPLESKNIKEGAGFDCQTKFKWFCDTKGEDGLYDAKGPVGIQECFKDARCSETLVKRSNDLLSSRFKRMSNDDKIYLGMLAKNLSGQEAIAFLRNQCHFEEDELLKRFSKYLEMRSKGSECLENKKPMQKKPVVITIQEMRERTARLRGNDLVQQEKQRKEEQRRRLAANRLMQNTFALQIRKSWRGSGKNMDIPSSIKMFM